MGLQQQVRETDDGRQDVVEVVRHAARKLANCFHLLALGELHLQCLQLGGVDDVEHSRLVRRPAAQGAEEDAARELPRPADCDLKRLDIGFPGQRIVQSGFHLCPPVGLDVACQNVERAVSTSRLTIHHQPRESRVGADDPTVCADRGDAERRRLEEAGKPHISRAAALTRVGFGNALEHGSDETGLAGTLHNEQRRRPYHAVLAHQIQIDPARSMLGIAGQRPGESAIVGNDIGQLQTACQRASRKAAMYNVPMSFSSSPATRRPRGIVS